MLRIVYNSFITARKIQVRYNRRTSFTYKTVVGVATIESEVAELAVAEVADRTMDPVYTLPEMALSMLASKTRTVAAVAEVAVRTILEQDAVAADSTVATVKLEVARCILRS